MKKLLLFFSALLLVFNFASCSEAPTPSFVTVPPTLPRIYLTAEINDKTVMDSFDSAELIIGIARDYRSEEPTATLTIEADYFHILSPDGQLYKDKYEYIYDDFDTLKYPLVTTPEGEKEIRHYESFVLHYECPEYATFITGYIDITLSVDGLLPSSHRIYYAAGSKIAFSHESEEAARLMIKEYNDAKSA